MAPPHAPPGNGVLANGEVVGRIFKANAAPGRKPVDVDLGFRTPRGSHADARLCGRPGGRHDGIREELATGMIKTKPAPVTTSRPAAAAATHTA